MKLTGIKKIDETTIPNYTNVEELSEMARPAKLCDKCGKSMSANHYWYNGGWKCKGGAAASSTQAAAPAAVPAPAAKAPAVTPPADPTSAPVTGHTKVKSTPEGLDWLKEFNKVAKTPTYTVQPDGTIDVDGSVDLRQMGIEKLPVRFGKVNGVFIASSDDLVYPDGCPQEVTQDCLLDYNEFKTLVGCPQIVGGSFTINGNPITSIEGLPREVGDRLFMTEMPNLKSLHNIHKSVKSIGKNRDGHFICTGTAIEEAVLGLLLIRNLNEVSLDDKQVTEILNKHLQGERDIDLCQDELIEAGKAAFAKL